MIQFCMFYNSLQLPQPMSCDPLGMVPGTTILLDPLVHAPTTQRTSIDLYKFCAALAWPEINKIKKCTI
jgi:hypothetical protein